MCGSERLSLAAVCSAKFEVDKSMFEEKVEVQETAPANAPEAPLFKDYEIRSWKLSPRIYKILSASLVLNLAAILVIGQSNMLTRKGCESPLVGGVCQVLDMMDLGSDLLGVDTQYIDGDYTHTDLSNSEVTFVDLTGREESQLKYPEGYFALANPEQFQPQLVETANTNGENPGFPDNIPGFTPSTPNVTTPGGNPGARAQVLPKSTGREVKGDLLDGFDDNAGEEASSTPPGMTKNPGGKTPRVNTKPTPDQSVASNDPSSMPAITINRTPLRELGRDVKDLIDQKKIDIGAVFNVIATGKLDSDGRIDPNSFKYVKLEGTDQGTVEVVKRSIIAVNDSGYLKWLEKLAGKELNLSISQDNEFITGIVQTEAESPARASTLKFLFSNYIKWTVDKKMAPTATEDDRDDLQLLQNATVEVDGKKLVIKFAVPKAAAHGLIQKKLVNNNNAQEPAKPSGGLQTGGLSPTAVK